MGRIRVGVTAEPLNAAAIAEEVRDPENGADITFVGAVRASNHGHRVVAVSYDVFSPLAEKVLQEICEEAAKECGGAVNLVVVHRRGKLNVGEPSIVIAAGSPHRDEVYLSSRYIIEQIKVRAPIWKKEHYEDGETEWLQGHALCSHGH
jgi:molybdopterin synthase catalytic subunit